MSPLSGPNDPPPDPHVPSFVRIVHALSRTCGVLAAGMIVVAVLITCQLIFVRFVLNESTIWQTEAVTYLMISATLIGLPYVQLLRGHVNVDLLPLLLPMGARRLLTVLVVLLTLTVVGLMLFYGYELFAMAYAGGWRSDTVWGVELWIPYLALPIGFGLFALQLVADLFDPVPVLGGAAEATLGEASDPLAQERVGAATKAELD